MNHLFLLICILIVSTSTGRCERGLGRDVTLDDAFHFRREEVLRRFENMVKSNSTDLVGTSIGDAILDDIDDGAQITEIHFAHVEGGLIKFNLDEDSFANIRHVDLHVHVRKPFGRHHALPKHYNLTVTEHYGADHTHVLTQTFSLREMDNHVKFHLRPENLERWTEKEFVGITIECLWKGHNLAMVSANSSHHHAAFIEIRSKNVEYNRKRREPDTCKARDRNAKAERCCLYNLWVSIRELGFPEMVGANRINVKVCAGDCRLNLKEMTTELKAHRVAAGTNWKEKKGIAGGMCCHPTKFVDAKFATIEKHNRIKEHRIKNLVIEECSCD